MAYQTISAILEAGNASSSFKEIATTYGITADYGLSVKVSNTLRKCFRASCQTSKSCTDSNATMYTYSLDDSNMTSYYDGLSICNGVAAPVQADIAGIGVLTYCCSAFGK